MIKLFKSKLNSKDQPIQDIDDSEYFYVPLAAHKGKPAISIVNIGQSVKKYQKIGMADGDFSANIHSPVSGYISAIEEVLLPQGSASLSIVIKNDYQNNSIDINPATDQHNSENFADLLKEFGIVGAGGAQFPTHIKYRLNGKKIKTFIINGAECEPYLSADYSIIKEYTKELTDVFSLINDLFKPDEIVLAIEKKHKDLIRKFRNLESSYTFPFRIKTLADKYPQGSELQLIKSVTGISMARGIRPIEKGILVNNAGTLLAIGNSLVTKRPVIDRIVTISGDKIIKSGNYKIKIGTPVSHVIKVLGLDKIAAEKEIVFGGPMMGHKIVNLQTAVQSGTSGILFLDKKVRTSHPCIQCGYCVDVCPMHLLPLEFAKAYENNDKQLFNKYHLDQCIECGACDYICPSNVPLIESIKNGKMHIN